MTLPRGLASYLWCTTQRDLGEYITVLDEREIEGNDGRMTELLLKFWAEERVAEEIRDLLHVSRNGPVGWANDGRLKLVRGSFAELAVFRPEIERTYPSIVLVNGLRIHMVYVQVSPREMGMES